MAEVARDYQPVADVLSVAQSAQLARILEDVPACSAILRHEGEEPLLEAVSKSRSRSSKLWSRRCLLRAPVILGVRFIA